MKLRSNHENEREEALSNHIKQPHLTISTNKDKKLAILLSHSWNVHTCG